MVLTERKEHIEILSEMLTKADLSVVELHGGISAKQRQERIITSIMSYPELRLVNGLVTLAIVPSVLVLLKIVDFRNR